MLFLVRRRMPIRMLADADAEADAGAEADVDA